LKMKSREKNRLPSRDRAHSFSLAARLLYQLNYGMKFIHVISSFRNSFPSSQKNCIVFLKPIGATQERTCGHRVQRIFETERTD